MAYNNIQGSGTGSIPITQSQAGQPVSEKYPSSATRDFQTGQAMSNTHGISSTDSTSQQASGAKVEEKLEREGHMPGLAEVQKDNEKDLRQPGQEDAAGNKIHHKGILKKMFHWEHNGMNAD
ncbi:MAG: hypothetical protein L6R40_003999 [Gallowayella cf. fulva]|nr:MAG: hypothetical protein L6R40_003999 [Xanthomendoza cf. fulva]